MPIFKLSNESMLNKRVGEDDDWKLIPLRIPSTWSVAWNGFDARRIGPNEIEINDSQDLLLLKSIRYDALFVDVGWYRTTFRAVVLKSNWGNILKSFETDEPDVLIAYIEHWLEIVPNFIEGTEEK